MNAEELAMRKDKKDILSEAMQSAKTVDFSSKIYVKEIIKTLLTELHRVKEDNIDFIIRFREPRRMTVKDKFEILMYHYGVSYGKKALEKIIDKYPLVDETRIIDGEDYYCITGEDIQEIYETERIQLKYLDKLEILTQRIYENVVGNYCIDILLEQNINGISGGVNGITGTGNENSSNVEVVINTGSKVEFKNSNVQHNYDSIWIMYKAKNVHMKFMSFEVIENLEDICKNIYKFGNVGQFSEKTGYVINQTASNSRVTVYRPPFCESWAFFIRNFDNELKDLDMLITGDNSSLVINLLDLLMKANMTSGITGVQGSGKTMLILALIKCIYPVYTLRIHEMFFELYARNKYPNRNILTFKEISDFLDLEKSIDVAKKSDGAVNIIQEVAEDRVAAQLIKVTQVASLFTIFGHHAKNTVGLVNSLRNSLLEHGGFQNEKIAEEQVVTVLDFNIHLAMTYEGKRYVERITEIIPVEYEEYPEGFKKETKFFLKLASFLDTTYTFYKKITDNRTYVYKNIIEYDVENNRYVVKNSISKSKIQRMFKSIAEKDKPRLQELLDTAFTNIKKA